MSGAWRRLADVFPILFMRVKRSPACLCKTPLQDSALILLRWHHVIDINLRKDKLHVRQKVRLIFRDKWCLGQSMISQGFLSFPGLGSVLWGGVRNTEVDPKCSYSGEGEQMSFWQFCCSCFECSILWCILSNCHHVCRDIIPSVDRKGCTDTWSKNFWMLIRK